jgi:hypothetical protein
MKLRTLLKAGAVALVLGLAACSGSEIASPGATAPGTGPGTGGGGGGGGGGGTPGTCPAGTTAASGTINGNTICNLPSVISANLSLPRIANVVYRLNGRTDVGVDLGASGALAGGQAATLTIEAGVRIFGDVAGDILIINRGSRINAVGTAASPIVFTSREDIAGTVNVDTDTRQWGGIILLGRAPIRGCNTAVPQGAEACQNAVEGVTAATGRDALYGGATPTDNSGTMRYVSIRHSSDFLTSAAAGDDLNGLTLGGVGNGTTLENIQVHNSGDDGIEWFGGNVNARFIAVTGALDDSLDYDEGFVGNLQFVFVRQAITGAGGPDRIIEGSNARRASTGDTLNTNPTIANFTFIGIRQNNGGTANLDGIALNNTGGTPGASSRFANGIVTGSTRCVNNGSANTGALAPRYDSVIFDCPTAADAAGLTNINAGSNNSTAVSNSLTGILPGPVELGRPAVNTTTLGAFFQAANYVGAFSPTETTANNWASGWTVAVQPSAAGCPAGTVDTQTVVSGQRNCRLSGVIGGTAAGSPPANVRLVAGNIYQLSGRVDVGVDLGGSGTAAGGVAASLTVDAGVRIYGRSAQDMLVVNRGSQIFVNGTATSPVIMTSEPDVTGTQANKATATREWAGLIVNGRAPIRGCNSSVARGDVACQNAVEGVTAATGRDALYGGATPTDTSGRIAFLQIRYPGAFLTSAAAGDDLNGLTLGGVGSGTEIRNVQVHNSGDDGIEIFGGTVNLRNLVITGALDDSFDLDDGWTGATQFLIITQSLTGSGGPDRLVESSNIQRAGTGIGLDTNPAIANFTMVGIRQSQTGANLEGLVLNNSGGTPGSSGRYFNGIVTGSTVCAVASAANPNPAPQFNSVLFSCPTAPNTATLAFINAGANNTVTTTDTTLTNRFVNGPSEASRTVTAIGAVSPFFTATTYVGAVRDANDTWWQGWSCGLAAGTTC